MPYSHSLLTTALGAMAVSLFVSKLMNRPRWGIALAVGVVSHTVLDVLVHAHDIQIAPGINAPKLGTGLYDLPLAAFAVEAIYGVWCWHRFQGSKALLAIILAFNLGAISFYSADIPGPEQLMAGRPLLFVAIIGMHIGAGLMAIFYFAHASWRAKVAGSPSR